MLICAAGDIHGATAGKEPLTATLKEEEVA
jgi:hypothetical protein